ncbi:hypothetical protein CER18_04570 [Bartonella tribocorum]|uniref:Uncharacterized protein n=1 Tax=Bartonella tribocorum TaxID=85701 RepID=A0A2M6USB5_9HYPH|nr:hypothetical protein CER18_04570 [Bartonella tribocorum]
MPIGKNAKIQKYSCAINPTPYYEQHYERGIKTTRDLSLQKLNALINTMAFFFINTIAFLFSKEIFILALAFASNNSA